LFADFSFAGLEARIPPTGWEEEQHRMCCGRNPKGRLRRKKQNVSTVVTESYPGGEAIQNLDPKFKMFFSINILV
jgi:hypothetical protein